MSDQAMEEIRALARPLASGSDLDPLLDSIGSSRFVLLGEASHGTSEYYSWRADITRRLIAEKGFSFVAVEGDWPDCYRVNRWVKHRSDHGRTAREVLGDFERWPAWMWANEEVAAFLGRLRDHNRASRRPAGFYGLDVYSLWESLDTVLEYLKAEHPDALETAKQAVRCFEPFGEDTSKYARSAGMVPSSCEKQVVDLLLELRSNPVRFTDDPEGSFDARQNAEVLAGAERYYRSMLGADADAWNIRDHHMADTLDRLMEHHGPGAKAVVWAHNTHVGDARATPMASDGMVNLGQLVRERHAGEERFGTWVPTVMGDRYDAFLYFEETRALTPLHPEQPQREGEQQTYPWSA